MTKNSNKKRENALDNYLHLKEYSWCKAFAQQTSFRIIGVVEKYKVCSLTEICNELKEPVTAEHAAAVNALVSSGYLAKCGTSVGGTLYMPYRKSMPYPLLPLPLSAFNFSFHCMGAN